ncbi:hypothetical protein [Flavobacterium notoginsengisoli]|uniref:hypothetical protein n=1 Tax=Flavobacterium notoginsengisoli TaxID=1478199 RepID=UPI00363DD39B
MSFSFLISYGQKEIKKYEEEPMYKMILSSSECSFSILVNDIPLYLFFGRSGGVSATSIPINRNVEKSGKQKITVRMYPKYSETEKNSQTLGVNAGVKFTIEKEIDGDDKTIVEFKTPFKDFDGKGNGGFLYPGKTFYEETIYVDLKVPYNLSVLDNAEILFTEDAKKLDQLEKEVVAKYNEIRNIYMTGTKEELANVNYNKEKRLAQQMYLNEAEIKDGWDNDYQFRTDSNLDFFDLKPIEKYEMKFYAEGKIITLEKINNKKSALWGGFKRKDKEVVTTTYILLYLYRPIGSNKLEIY